MIGILIIFKLAKPVKSKKAASNDTASIKK
jgi:hypothetical protein